MEKPKDDIHLKVAIKRYNFLSQKDATYGLEKFDEAVGMLSDLDLPISVFEKVLAIKKGELNALVNETIPSIMMTDFGGLTAMEYEDRTVKIKEELTVTVVDDERLAEVFEEYGREDLIKTTVNFPRGMDASWVIEKAKEEGYEIGEDDIKKGVHWKTRNKALQDIINQYPDQKMEDLFPADAVSVSIFKRAEIKEK